MEKKWIIGLLTLMVLVSGCTSTTTVRPAEPTPEAPTSRVISTPTITPNVISTPTITPNAISTPTITIQATPTSTMTPNVTPQY